MRLDELMRLAIDKGEPAIEKGQTPFGCAIALDGRILAADHNTVWASTDITCHAEVNAIRAACRELGLIFLEGATVASTCEPCPMCMAALHWARVVTVWTPSSARLPACARTGKMPVLQGNLKKIFS